MRAFSYTCSLRSRDKDGGYTIWSTVPKNPILHTNVTALCLIEWELLPIEVLHCGNRNFQPFCRLWLWPWPDDLHIRTWPVDHEDMPHVHIRTSYITAFESYRKLQSHHNVGLWMGLNTICDFPSVTDIVSEVLAITGWWGNSVGCGRDLGRCKGNSTRSSLSLERLVRGPRPRLLVSLEWRGGTWAVKWQQRLVPIYSWWQTGNDVFQW